jgi:hypothetical protein
MICQHCQREFEATRRAKFCSTICRVYAWRQARRAPPKKKPGIGDIEIDWSLVKLG